jgi:hypothetical protein
MLRVIGPFLVPILPVQIAYDDAVEDDALDGRYDYAAC